MKGIHPSPVTFSSVIDLSLLHFRTNGSWSLKESQKYRRYAFPKLYICFLTSPHSDSDLGSDFFPPLPSILSVSLIYPQSSACLVARQEQQPSTPCLKEAFVKHARWKLIARCKVKTDWFTHPLSDYTTCNHEEKRGILNTVTGYNEHMQTFMSG